MATEAQQPLKITLEAGADLSSTGSNSQYRFVKRDANGRAVSVAAATDIPVGVLQNNPNALGKAAEIVVVGITKLVVTAGGTAFTTANDGVASFTDGTAQKATATGFGGAYVQGTKSLVGYLSNINVVGGAAPTPAASNVTRASVNCLTVVPAT